MQEYGKILAILSDTHFLIRSSESIRPQTVLTVFQRLESEKLSQLGVESLSVPKGEIRVTMEQGPDLYLAERFTKKVGTRQIPNPLTGSMAGIFGPQEVDVKEWSAEIEETQSLNLPIDPVVRIGDAVGVK